eukprot:gene11777-2093_t
MPGDPGRRFTIPLLEYCVVFGGWSSGEGCSPGDYDVKRLSVWNSRSVVVYLSTLVSLVCTRALVVWGNRTQGLIQTHDWADFFRDC